MNKINTVLNDKRRVDADKQTAGVAQPGNRKEPNQGYRQKACLGCGDYFTRSRRSNHDYCLNCVINDNRYVKNKCPECGDGFGIIKFSNQKPKACKLCHLNWEPKIIQNEYKSWINEENKHG